MAFHPSENLFASAGDDGIIKLWKINDEEILWIKMCWSYVKILYLDEKHWFN